MCRVLQVTRAAFYKWLGRTTSTAQQKQKQIVTEIKRIHTLPCHQDYGSPRIHCELIKQGTKCSVNTIAKLMRIYGIQARNKPRFRIATTDSKHDLPIAPNRFNQQFIVSKLNKVWLTDFTYIPTREGFSYLCAFKDLCSRRIVGWAMSRKIDAQLAIAALNQAVALRDPPRSLIIHSDRGSQFASNAFRKRLRKCQFKQSMSRKGNGYDNGLYYAADGINFLQVLDENGSPTVTSELSAPGAFRNDLFDYSDGDGISWGIQMAGNQNSGRFLSRFDIGFSSVPEPNALFILAGSAGLLITRRKRSH